MKTIKELSDDEQMEAAIKSRNDQALQQLKSTHHKIITDLRDSQCKMWRDGLPKLLIYSLVWLVTYLTILILKYFELK